MFYIDDNKTIHLTRGDIAVIGVSASKSEEEDYIFQAVDVVRFTVFEKGRCDSIVLLKDVVVSNDTLTVDISLTSDDTRIGDPIHKPKDYWYEIEVNPDTTPQTLIGYDDNGPKVFRLYPEGDSKSWASRQSIS